MIAKWSPGDDELDGIARSLPSPNRDADRIEQERTNVLAQAAGLTQHKRGSRLPIIAAVATTFAAAAALLLWFVARPTEPSPKELITALGPAQYQRTSAWPDFVVRIDDGRVAIEVSHLAARERFRATTSDAEIEVRGTKFIVAAAHSRVSFVSVSDGSAEVRWAQQPVVIVAAGQTWSPPQIAQREAIELASPQPTAPPTTAQTDMSTATVQIVPTAPKSKATRRTKAPAHVATTTAPHDANARPDTKPIAPSSDAQPKPQVAAAPPAKPGELEFRAGMAALRAGDPAAAAKSFAASCTAAHGDALAEDACFWVGAAANRANQTSIARDALTRFLAEFPRSSRVGEASALLGWILYNADELDAASKRFERAAKDSVPKVRESADRGIEAIRRKRNAP